MDFVVIVRDNITVCGEEATDASLKSLDAYYESPVFHVEGLSSYPQIFEHVWPSIEPYIQHMLWPTAEIVEV